MADASPTQEDNSNLTELQLPNHSECAKIGLWEGYDPRDEDWACSNCRHPNYIECLVCEWCKSERQFNVEEEEQIEESERSGRHRFQRVFFSEAAVPERARSFSKRLRLDGRPDVVGCRFVQLWCIDNRTYVLVAIPPVRRPGDAENLSLGEEFALGGLLRVCKPDYTLYNYPTPRSLDQISEEILQQRFPHVGDYYQMKEKPRVGDCTLLGDGFGLLSIGHESD